MRGSEEIAFLILTRKELQKLNKNILNLNKNIKDFSVESSNYATRMEY